MKWEFSEKIFAVVVMVSMVVVMVSMVVVMVSMVVVMVSMVVVMVSMVVGDLGAILKTFINRIPSLGTHSLHGPTHPPPSVDPLETRL